MSGNLDVTNNLLQNVISITTNARYITMPDNFDLGNLAGNGWFDVWSTDKAISHAPENGLGRLLVHQQMVLDTNNVAIRIQTVFEWYTNLDNLTPRVWKRWVFLRPAGYAWTDWKEL